MMLRPALSACALVLAATSVVRGQDVSVLDGLTVPESARPATCVPVPSETERVGESRFRTGLWDGLGIDRNPWSGTTWRVLSKMRSVMADSPRVPDAPPDARLNAKLQRDLVEGMAGYAAFYRDGDARVSVYALRFAEAPPWTPASAPDQTESAGRAVVRLSRGRVRVLAVGTPGACFTAVEQHLRAVVPTLAPTEAPK